MGLCPALAGGLFAATQLDLEFDPGTGASGPIEAIAVQSDGRLLVAGMFDEFNGHPHHLITRLNPDGSVDPTWDLASASLPFTHKPVVVEVLVDADDNVLLMWQDDSWLRGWRFGRDGVGDTSPGSPLPYSSFEIPRALSWGVPSLALTASDDVLVGRNWCDVIGISAICYVWMDKYQADGTKGLSFSLQWPEMNGWQGGGHDEMQALTVTDDGEILAGGRFHLVGGAEDLYDMLRFDPDGSFDQAGSWSRTGDFYSVDQLIALPGDRVLVRDRSSISVVERDGNPAAGFTIPEVHHLGVSSVGRFGDGRILLAGGFTSINGIARNMVAALLPDGTVDPSFDPGAGPALEPYGSRFQVAPQPDGGVFVLGNFDSFDGYPRAGVARLKPAFPTEGTELFLGSTGLAAAETDGSLEVLVVRRGDLETRCSADYRTAPQTALPGSDYLPIGGTLTFEPGETIKTLTIPIIDDWVEDPDETFEVFLINPVGAILVPGRDRVLATIVNEDRAVGFSSETALVNEPNGMYWAHIGYHSGVDVLLDDISAIRGQDYLPAESNGSSIGIPIPDNLVADGDRSFRISLVNFRSPYVPGAITTQVVTIRDNDTVIRPARGLNGPILAVAPDANGGWWAGGEFTLYDGFERPYLARLQPDLTLDEDWSMAQPPDGTVEDVWPAEDGSMYLAGDFRTFGEVLSPGLARVLANGALDSTFQPYTTAPMRTLEQQFVEGLLLSDGSLVALNRAGELVHLNPDGMLIGIVDTVPRDSRYLTPLVSGGFALNTYSLRVYGPDRQRDLRFNATSLNLGDRFLVQSDDSVWLAPYVSLGSRSLRHLSSEGELLHEISTIPAEGLERGFSVRELVRLPDDRFLAFLYVPELEGTGTYPYVWIRFFPDGEVDSDFQASLPSFQILAGFLAAIPAEANRATVGLAGSPGRYLVRINSEGYLVNDLRFEAIARLPDGDVHLTFLGQPGYNYTLEVSEDLTERAELPRPDGWRTEWMNRIDREAAGKSTRFDRLRFW